MIVGVSDKLLTPWLEGKEFIDCSDEGEAVAIAAGAYLADGQTHTAFMSVDGLCNALNFITSWIVPEGIPLHLVISIGRTEPAHIVATELTPAIIQSLQLYDTARISYELVFKQ